MMRKPLFAIFLGLLVAVVPSGSLNANVIPDPAKNWGVWEGWGTSLCWFAKVFGNRDDVADLLFTAKTVDFNGEKLPGLGLNIVRYNAGACGWNTLPGGRRMAVSKTILPFRQMEGYWLDPANADPSSLCWNWSVDVNQRALLLKARERGVNHFELFSNSPMWWMCRNNNPSGAADASKDNLAPSNYQAFATYLAAIAARAKSRWGVAFTSIEPFNEPSTRYWGANGKQEGCHFNAASQAAFLPILRGELDKRGLKDLPIAASDETAYDDALRTWKSFPPEVKALVSRLNVHGYSLGKGNRAGIYQALTVESRKAIWNTEHGDRFPDGLEMARNIHRDMALLHPTAWCYWQPLDGGNNGGWGLVAADMQNGIIGEANPKYFVLAQYTRHIHPGMTVLNTEDKAVIAAYDGCAHRLAMVVLNDGPARQWSCDLSHFSSVGGPVACWDTEPKAAARYEKRSSATLDGKALVCALPADSVQTFEVENIVP